MTDLENKVESLDVDVKSDCKSLDLDIKLEDDIFGGHHVPIDDTTTEIDSIYHYSALMLKSAIRQAATVQDLRDAFQIVPDALLKDTINYTNSPVVDTIHRALITSEYNHQIKYIDDLLRYVSANTNRVALAKFLLSKTEITAKLKKDLVQYAMLLGRTKLVIYYLSVFGTIYVEHVFHALYEGHKNLVRYVLNNYEVSDIQKNVLLVIAAVKGYLDMVEFLIKKGSDINFNPSKTFKGAIMTGDLPLVKFLIENGISINDRISMYLTVALELPRTDIYEYLISLKIATTENIIHASIRASINARNLTLNI